MVRGPIGIIKVNYFLLHAFITITVYKMKTIFSSPFSKHEVLFHSPAHVLFCKICAKTFAMADERDTHQIECGLQKRMTAHRAKGSFECFMCKKAYTTNSELRRYAHHFIIIKKINLLPIWRIILVMNLFSFCRHVRVKHESDNYKCTTCNAVFVLAATLQNHKCREKPQYPNGIKLPCELCGKIINKSSLKSHRILFHSPPGTIICRTCTRTFSTNEEKDAHLFECKESLRRQCEICNKVWLN